MVTHNSAHITLASASAVRCSLLKNAGLAVTATPARIDEQALSASARAEGLSSRDIADFLAEKKAEKVAMKVDHGLVLGCDQTLDFNGETLSKSPDLDHVRGQIRAMMGNQHRLHAAAVLFENGRLIWRHVGTVRLTMRTMSDAWLDDYLARNRDDVLASVGGYMLEREGIRMMTRVEGDYFHVLGLPLLELLNFLTERGTLPV